MDEKRFKNSSAEFYDTFAPTSMVWYGMDPLTLCARARRTRVSSREEDQSIPSAAIFLPPPTTDRSGPPGPMVRRGGRGQRTHAPRGPALSSVPREESLSAVQCAHGGTSHKVRRPLLGPFRDLHLLSTTGLHAGDRTPPPPCGAVPSGQHEPQEPQDLARQGGAPGYVRPAAE